MGPAGSRCTPFAYNNDHLLDPVVYRKFAPRALASYHVRAKPAHNFVPSNRRSVGTSALDFGFDADHARSTVYGVNMPGASARLAEEYDKILDLYVLMPTRGCHY